MLLGRLQMNKVQIEIYTKKGKALEKLIKVFECPGATIYKALEKAEDKAIQYCTKNSIKWEFLLFKLLDGSQNKVIKESYTKPEPEPKVEPKPKSKGKKVKTEPEPKVKGKRGRKPKNKDAFRSK